MSINFSEDAQQEVVTSSRVLPEDSGEGSLRPRLLRDYIGQEKAKENLQVAEQKLHPHGHGWSIVNNVDQWSWKTE